jgi:mRNA deadenylase 3'-5' endonuclease subunit Ccr4
MLVKHLISPATLPQAAVLFPPVQQQLSVLSYNVLLPNSEDGWWTYKMYMPPFPEELKYASSWDFRRDLLKDRIQLIDADVVCLQEVAPKSFEKDFEFMKDLGYDEHELFKKGRFRPATFWKSSQCKLAMPAVHKDRCLLTALQLLNTAESDEKHNWYVCNCHLQAGKQGGRRLRQINEAMRGILTMARKQKGTGRSCLCLSVAILSFSQT